jgi:hypothetical protein
VPLAPSEDAVAEKAATKCPSEQTRSPDARRSGFFVAAVTPFLAWRESAGFLPRSILRRHPMARIPIPDAETYKALRLPHFDGFPYLATYVVATFYHVILLPSALDLEEMTRIAVRQVKANRLKTCLVLGEDSCIYFGTDGSPAPSDCVPGCSKWTTDKLLPGPIFIDDEELRARRERLYAFIKAGTHGQYFMGDLTKGGRPATDEELARLAGFSARGIPKGLSQCGACGGWRGECLDPKTDVFKDKVMKVYCSCQNDNLCARCGYPLYEYKLNANYYGDDGIIWRVPGFCGLDHHCADPESIAEKSPGESIDGIELTGGHPEKRDPSEIAECDGCEELFYERELIEIKPGLYVCKSCGDDYETLMGLGLTLDEIENFARLKRCDWCGQPLTEVEPGRWLCRGCFLLSPSRRDRL